MSVFHGMRHLNSSLVSEEFLDKAVSLLELERLYPPNFGIIGLGLHNFR